MKRADLVVVFAGTKQRIGVVMRCLDDGRLVILYGTGSEPSDPDVRHVRVDERERYGIALRLEKPTYFLARNVAIAGVEKVKALGRACPPGLFLALEALIV